MSAISAEVVGRLWRWPGDAAWHFLTLPGGLSDEIRSRVEPVGFGAVKVSATIGATTWSTSVFPDKESGCYVLPVKAAVRRAERIATDDEVAVVIVVEPGLPRGGPTATARAGGRRSHAGP